MQNCGGLVDHGGYPDGGGAGVGVRLCVRLKWGYHDS